MPWLVDIHGRPALFQSIGGGVDGGGEVGGGTGKKGGREGENCDGAGNN